MGWHFRLFGIPVRVQPWFVLVAVLLGTRSRAPGGDWLLQLLIWVGVVFTGVLLHELGHAFVGRAYGLMPRIELHGFGGLTWWDRSHELSPAKSMFVSFAGPAVGIAIGFLAWILNHSLRLPEDGWVSFTLATMVWVNFGWGVLNLLPMLPLDGGNILASFLRFFSEDRGRTWARMISLVIAAAALAWAIKLQLWIGAAIVAFLAWENFQGLRVEGRIRRQARMAPELEQARLCLERGDFDGAAEAARVLLDRITDASVRDQALYVLAWSHVLAGRARDAQQAINQMSGAQPIDPALQGSVLVELGVHDEGLKHLAKALATRHAPIVETQIVQAFKQTQRFDDAAALFESAAGDNAHPETMFEVEKLAYEAGDFSAAARLGEVLFEREGNPLRAFNVACSLSRDGRPAEALEWLERALGAGFDDLHLLDTDTDLESVRALPEYVSLRQSLRKV